VIARAAGVIDLTTMPLFAATIALSAFLLFLVQPVVAKQILPWFGGGSAVWTTCLVFFQVLLLAGYAYAHWSTRNLTPRRQAQLHIALLVASLAFLPIIPRGALRPAGGEDAALAIIVLLLATVGLPYFLLSSTGPLLQKWVAHRFAERSVYRLFALSNLGSLLGLLAFPFAIEPLAGSRRQSYVWSAVYIVFVLACACTAWLARERRVAGDAPGGSTGEASDSGAIGTVRASTLDSNVEPVASSLAPRRRDYAVWLLLPALGSVLLLATTSHVTQNIASVPFLWVLPLTLYLLTFVLAFEGRGGRGWYERKFMVWPILLLLVAMSWGLSAHNGVLDISLAVILYGVGLFGACLLCHGELARRKPAPQFLTHFYLLVSAGGALGGLLVGLVAPRVFSTYYELPLALFAAAAVAAALAWRRPWLVLAALVAAVACAYFGWQYFDFLRDDVIARQRNFYGTLRVREIGTGETQYRRLMHGVILHGEQLTNSPKKLEPGSYYARTSGVGLAIAAQQARGAIKLGVIGLGTGTLSAYGRAGDIVRFYELDPDVLQLSRRYFTYLESTPATLQFAIGDARLSLERELATQQIQKFDVLAVDAFSSDSIPVHLITREAIALYEKHMALGGIIAVHVSNRFLDLKPVLANIAAAEGLTVELVDDSPSDESGASSTDWVLLAQSPAAFQVEPLADRVEPIEPEPRFSLWTDQFNNLLDVLKSHPLYEVKSLFSDE